MDRKYLYFTALVTTSKDTSCYVSGIIDLPRNSTTISLLSFKDKIYQIRTKDNPNLQHEGFRSSIQFSILNQFETTEYDFMNHKEVLIFT